MSEREQRVKTPKNRGGRPRGRQPFRHDPVKLNRMRWSKFLTLTALAERAGCSRSYLSHLEHGDFGPSQDLLERLADALGCSIEDLKPGRSVGKVA